MSIEFTIEQQKYYILTFQGLAYENITFLVEKIAACSL